jgi:hypothetical protein
MGLSARHSARLLAATGFAAAAVLALSAATAGKLALKPGMGGVPDLGAIQCKTFNAMYPSGPTGLRQSILYYTEGYVYARTGKTMDDFLASVPRPEQWNFETLTGEIVSFCLANPEVPVPIAVADLLGRLSP